MKFAEKMVLIPEAEYHALLNKPGKTSELKKEMKDVLKGKRDHTAATKMSQLVGAYLRHKESVKPPKRKQEDFLEYFHTIYHGKVKSLLSQLHSNRIEWNEEYELILPSGQIIAKSNIVDLIREALVSTKKKSPAPIGWNAFTEAIALSAIPKSLFNKKSTLKAIVQHKPEHEWEML